jgi:RimJ/RimL family protein N-acetyltransferase
MESVPGASLGALPVSRAHPARAIGCVTTAGDLTLRPLLMSDTEQVEQAVYESRKELQRFMPWAHVERNYVAQLERRRATEADYFAARELNMGLFSEDRTLVVVCGLHFRVPLNPNAVECGYWTRTGHTGRGFATLALQIATLYAFDKLGCDRVQVLHNEENAASCRVVEKCGFQREGMLRNVTAAPSAELVRGGYVQTRKSVLWALVDCDLDALSWVPPLRARLSYVNMAGYTLPSSGG